MDYVPILPDSELETLWVGEGDFLIGPKGGRVEFYGEGDRIAMPKEGRVIGVMSGNRLTVTTPNGRIIGYNP